MEGTVGMEVVSCPVALKIPPVKRPIQCLIGVSRGSHYSSDLTTMEIIFQEAHRRTGIFIVRY